MNRPRWLLAVAIVIMLISPMGFMVLDADSSSLVSVSIQGYDVDPLTDEVDIEMKSGETKTYTMFVVNKTASRYSVYIEDSESDDGKVHLKSVDSSSTILKPAGSDDSEDIMSLSFSIATDVYMNNGVRHVSLELHLQNLDDSQYYKIDMSLGVDVDSATDMNQSYNKFLGLFPNTLSGEFGKPWFTALVSFVVISLLVWIVCLILLPSILIALKVSRKGEDYEHMKRGLVATCLVISFVLAFNTSLQIYGVDSELYYTIAMISNVIYTLAGAVIAWDIYLFIVLRVVGSVEKNLNNEENSLIPLFKLLGELIICVAAVTIILASFGVDLAGLLVSAGVVSLGITLGAQNVLGQFFSGLILLATRPFKAGDFIQIGDDVFIVKNVKLMYTEFSNWGKDQVVTMPNNMVSSSKIINLTKGNKIARINVYITVAYDTDIPKAKAIMLEAANHNENVVLDGSFSRPSVTLTDWLDSGIQLRLSCYVDDFDASKGITGALREKITQMFRDNGIEIPYTRVQIDILSDRTEC